MQLFLDAATRALRAQAPDGPHRIEPAVIANTVVFTVSDDAWKATYQPAWLAAYQANQDLVVAVDGSTSTIPHTASPLEQSVTILTTYLANPAPTLVDTTLALKTLIRVAQRLVR